MQHGKNNRVGMPLAGGTTPAGTVLTTKDLKNYSDDEADFVDLRKYFPRGKTAYKSLPPSNIRPRSSSVGHPADNSRSLTRPPIAYKRHSVARETQQPETSNFDHRAYESEAESSRPLKKLVRSGSFRGIAKFFRKLKVGLNGPTNHYNNDPVVDRPHSRGTNDGSRPSSFLLENPHDFDDTQSLFAPPTVLNGHGDTNRNGRQRENDADSHISAPAAIMSTEGNGYGQNLVLLTDLGTPAVCGIRNLGNSCYLNAIVQCLANTDPLAEYFVTDKYVFDLSYSLNRGASKLSTNGEMTTALAHLIKAIWCNQTTKKVAEMFKASVGKYSSQYRGTQQQDAQEFFLWLIDKVHEDINSATRKKYKPVKEVRGKPEFIRAQEILESHSGRDKSYMTDLFQAQFRSAVVCPDCKHTSLAYDPYSCVSLPVPQSNAKPLFVVLVFLNRYPRLLCLGLNADVSATFGEVSDCLSVEAQMHKTHIVLCELSSTQFSRTFMRSQLIGSVSQLSTIYAFETPSVGAKKSSGTVTPSSSAADMQTEEIILLVMSRVKHGKSFAGPFSVKASREISYLDLLRTLFGAMKTQLATGVKPTDIPPMVLRLRVMDSFSPSDNYLPMSVDMPLYSEVIDSALADFNSEMGPPHVKVVLEWEQSAREKYFKAEDEVCADHISACDLRTEQRRTKTPSLDDCLKLYTQPETINWWCPHCRGREKMAEKAITFWSLPDILVFHLKRFKMQPSGEHIKLDPIVSFPIQNLNMTPYLYEGSVSASSQDSSQEASPTRPSSHSKYGSLGRKSPKAQNHSRKIFSFGNSHDAPVTQSYELQRDNQSHYDLYAVCNHHGESMNSGHYTAYCRNPVDERWYHFDDQKVTKVVNEKDIITNNAYLLFYERRGLNHVNFCRSSTESGFIEHWANRVYIAESNGSRDTLSNNDTEDEAIGNTGRHRSPSCDSSQKRSKSAASQQPAVGDLETAKNTLANRRAAQISTPYTNGSTPVATKDLKELSVTLTPLTPEVIEKYKVKVESTPPTKPLEDEKPLISFDETVIPAKIPKNVANHSVATRSKSSSSALVTDLLGNWSPTGTDGNPAGSGQPVCSTPNSGATRQQTDRRRGFDDLVSQRRTSQRIKTKSKVETDF